MKTSIFLPVLNLKHLLHVTFIFSLLFTTNIALASGETPPANPKVISSKTTQININTADAQLISSVLKGIGLKKAEAIIDYRTTKT